MRITKYFISNVAMLMLLFNLIQINTFTYTKNDNWLTLSTNKAGPRYIVNSKGEPFQMFGMARAQICAATDEDPVYGGIDILCKYFRAFGCNSIRLAISKTSNDGSKSDLIMNCGGYNSAGIRKFIDKYVDTDVRAIIDNGMYVVLDLHEYPPNDSKTDPNPALLIQYARDKYIPIWAELSKKYKDEPMVAMYELWNEPYAADQGSLKIDQNGEICEGAYTGYDWNANVRNFFIDCVSAVRKYDNKHMILVSDFNAGWGTGWSTTWDGYVDKVDLTCNNVLYSVHAQKEHYQSATYTNYWTSTASTNNICFQFGEIETEGESATEESIRDFINFLRDKASIYHFSAFLWRPHNNYINDYDYASVWNSFAVDYTNKPLFYTDNASLNNSSVSNTKAVTVNSSISESMLSKQKLSSTSVSNTTSSINNIIIKSISALILIILVATIYFIFLKNSRKM